MEEVISSSDANMDRGMLTLTCRYDLEGKLTNMMQNLTTLPGAPNSFSTVTRGSPNDGLFPLMRTHTEVS